MKKALRIEVCNLFKEHPNIDYIRGVYPDVDVYEIISCLMEENLIKKPPKKNYTAGVVSYVLSDTDIINKVKGYLKKGKSHSYICDKIHIGHERLNKLIDQYGLEDVNQNLNNSKKPIQLNQKVSKFSKSKQIVQTVTAKLKESKKSVLTDEDIKQQIIYKLQQGQTKKQICKDLHIGYARLTNLLKDNIKVDEQPVKMKELKLEPQANNEQHQVKGKEITVGLIGTIQEYIHQGYDDTYIVKQLSISVNKLKTIKKLLKQTQMKDSADMQTDAQNPSVEEKIVYLNNIYGINGWQFLTKDKWKMAIRECTVF